MINPLLKNNVVFIISGVSGSGKTTFAEFLETFLGENHNVEVCTSDDFFMENGVYNFDISKLNRAHVWCKTKFKEALSENTRFVIVANTNTTKKEKNFYIEHAREKGYEVVEMIMNGGYDDVHNVPSDVVLEQRKNLINSIKNNPKGDML